jgi:hypothetical protein
MMWSDPSETEPNCIDLNWIVLYYTALNSITLSWMAQREHENMNDEQSDNDDDDLANWKNLLHWMKG